MCRNPVSLNIFVVSVFLKIPMKVCIVSFSAFFKTKTKTKIKLITNCLKVGLVIIVVFEFFFMGCGETTFAPSSVAAGKSLNEPVFLSIFK